MAFWLTLECKDCSSQDSTKPSVAVTTLWFPIEVPLTDDVKKLEVFLDATKKRQPTNPEQYIEMQRALRFVSKKLIELIQDRNVPLFAKAEAEYINASVMLLGNDGADAQQQTFERFRVYLKEKASIEFVDIQMAILAGQNLEQLADPTLAKQAYRAFAAIFWEKDPEQFKDIIAMLESNARRLDFPGNPFPLNSSTMSGEDFNIESYRGKYVLVYFWESGARACEQEHPYMLSVYNKYKDKGFEIVGIGLDEKKGVALAFIQRLQIPWVNLWESRKNGVSKVMETFGVSAVPTSFLIDKSGKVITIEARGLLLGKALEKLLPDEVVPSDLPKK